MEAATAPPPAAGSRLLLAGAVGALVALSLGIYGHSTTRRPTSSITLGFRTRSR